MTPAEINAADPRTLPAPPTLPRGCGSWVCTSPTGRAVEFFIEMNARRALAAGWRVEPAIAHLGRINAEIKARGGA